MHKLPIANRIRAIGALADFCSDFRVRAANERQVAFANNAGKLLRHFKRTIRVRPCPRNICDVSPTAA